MVCLFPNKSINPQFMTAPHANAWRNSVASLVTSKTGVGEKWHPVWVLRVLYIIIFVFKNAIIIRYIWRTMHRVGTLQVTLLSCQSIIHIFIRADLPVPGRHSINANAMTQPYRIQVKDSHVFTNDFWTLVNWHPFSSPLACDKYRKYVDLWVHICHEVAFQHMKLKSSCYIESLTDMCNPFNGPNNLGSLVGSEYYAPRKVIGWPEGFRVWINIRLNLGHGH